jgi:protein-S-isoprenylcysteine O-methyltransferase Ste14
MRATEFEFRHRFWIIGLIFNAAFFCYAFDHTNVSWYLVRLISAGRIGPDFSRGQLLLRLLYIFAGLVVGAAAALRTWASAYLKAEVVLDSGLHSETLVADGPYRYLRNPLYLGTILCAVGMGLLASRTGFLLLVSAIAVFMYRLMLREEAALLAQQGERFRAYVRAVPRLVPALTARLPSAGLQPLWQQAWAGEAWFWGFALSIFALAATLSVRVFYGVLGLSFFAYFAVVIVLRRSRNKQR